MPDLLTVASSDLPPLRAELMGFHRFSNPKTMWKLAVVLLCCSLLQPVSALLPGPNVCVRQVVRKVNVTRAISIPHIVQTQTWCFPKLHCVKNRTEYSHGFRTVSILFIRSDFIQNLEYGCWTVLLESFSSSGCQGKTRRSKAIRR